MEPIVHNDLRGFIDEAKKISQWREIEGADWDKEIGSLIEATAELIPQAPMFIKSDSGSALITVSPVPR